MQEKKIGEKREVEKGCVSTGRVFNCRLLKASVGHGDGRFGALERAWAWQGLCCRD